MLAQRCTFGRLGNAEIAKMELTVGQIATIIGGKIEGDAGTIIKSFDPIESAADGSISFLSNPKYERFLYKTKASAVIIAKDLRLKQSVSSNLIRVDDPYMAFTILVDEHRKVQVMEKEGIESPVFFDKSSNHGSRFYLGAFSYIGRNVKIGNNVKVFPNTTIGDNTKIGHNSVIYSGVNIYPDTVIGDYCTIHSGAVIGSDGFGYAPVADGTYKSIPQTGNVIIKDHVDIGANTVIDCATIRATIIEKGVKLDNLIQVAHNVRIGENTVIAAQAGISGSSSIGSNCVIGGQAGVVGHIHIADNTKIQAQSGVAKSTGEMSRLYGSPALDYNNYIRSYVVFKKLPEVMKQIERLEEKILNLPTIKPD